MRSNFLLVATALASTAMATSYNYARGLDADYSEFEERDAFSSEEEAAHFLRNIDDDELNALYVRGRARPGAEQPIHPGTLAARSRKTRITPHKNKPVVSGKPSGAKPNNRFKNFAKDRFGAKTIGAILPGKKTRRGLITDLANARNKKPSLPTKPSRAKPDRRFKKLFGDGLSGIKNASRKKNRRSMSGNIGGKKQRLRGPGTAAARRQRQAMNTKLLAGTPKKIPRRG